MKSLTEAAVKVLTKQDGKDKNKDADIAKATAVPADTSSNVKGATASVDSTMAKTDTTPTRRFGLGGVDPQTKKPFAGVQPGRDPRNTITGRLADLFIPRRDPKSGSLYMGRKVGDDSASGNDRVKSTATTPDATTSSNVSKAADQISSEKPKQSFGDAFKAAREARLKGGADTFEWNGKKYTSYQKGEQRAAAKPAAPAATNTVAAAANRSASAAATAQAATQPKGEDLYDKLVTKGIRTATEPKK